MLSDCQDYFMTSSFLNHHLLADNIRNTCLLICFEVPETDFEIDVDNKKVIVTSTKPMAELQEALKKSGKEINLLNSEEPKAKQ